MKSNMFAVVPFVATIIVGGSFSEEAFGQVVTFQYTGVIDSIEQNFDGFPFPPDSIATFGSFDVNDSFTITFSYDTSVPATFGDSGQAFFDDSLTSLEFELGGGGYTSSATSGRIFQRNLGIDNFNLFNIPLADHNGKAYAGNFPFDLVQLRDDEATIIADALVILNPIPAASFWEDRPMKLEFGQVTQMVGAGPPITLPEFTVLGTVSRITIAVPPCPTDTNGDGVTNVLDLIDVLLAFGQPCP